MANDANRIFRLGMVVGFVTGIGFLKIVEASSDDGQSVAQIRQEVLANIRAQGRVVTDTTHVADPEFKNTFVEVVDTTYVVPALVLHP